MDRPTFSLDTRDRKELERVFAPIRASRAGVEFKLFGSRARGDARRTSDIDIALYSPSAIPTADMAALREALEESRVPFRVDLVDYAKADSELRAAIDSESIPWPA